MAMSSFAIFLFLGIAASYRVHMGNTKAASDDLQATADDAEALPGKDSPCGCSETGDVKGTATGKAGCAMHFGQRFGYICYVNGGKQGGSCEGAKPSKLGVYWRPCPAEKAAADAKAALLKIMPTIELAAIERALKLAEEKHVDGPTISEAEKRVEHVKVMLAVEKELDDALPTYDTERLRKVLEHVEETELDSHLDEKTLGNAVERLEWLTERDEKTAELEAAIAGHLIRVLRPAIAEGRRMRVESDVMMKGDARAKELDQAIKEAAAALKKAMAGDHNHDELKKALAEATKLEAASEGDLAKAQGRLERLLERWEAKKELIEASRGDEMWPIIHALKKANQLNVDKETIQMAEENKKRCQEIMHEAKVLLSRLVEDKNSDKAQLRTAIDEARRLKATSNKRLEEAEAILAKKR